MGSTIVAVLSSCAMVCSIPIRSGVARRGAFLQCTLSTLASTTTYGST